MLSYQHIYHAGNPADIHKHLTLAGVLSLLTRKARGISYLETHAGRGLYDLASEEAQKTGEFAEGIARMNLPPGAYAEAVTALRAQYGPSAYPGSPLIARHLLRDQDKMHLMELHPKEHAALKSALKGSGAAVHHRDGYEGVLALSPPKPRKGLVLVDPSFEMKDEYLAVPDFVHKLMAKWAEASILIWYPILRAGRHEDMIAALKLPFLRDEVFFDLKGGVGMLGSGLIAVNPPFGIKDVFAQTVSASPILYSNPREAGPHQ